MSAAFHIANGLGDAIDSPSPEQMRAFLRELDPSDEEHGAAWLATDDGGTLEYNVDGRLVFEREGAVRHLANVTHEQVIELWCALASGNSALVEKQPWRGGNGFVLTPERRAEMRRAELASARAFYDSLGAERGDAPCRRDGCPRGAIAHSVLCRVHHFESVMRRECPFDD